MRALLLLLLFAFASANAQVYRWVDGNGTVTYSNERPPSGEWRIVPSNPTA